ncbi:MAG: hypothetical protein AAF590_07470 [Pseudomonadota bacterium]
MSDDTKTALSPTVEPRGISDEDYDAIASAVMETERGRWFLAEYAKRNRVADTQVVLTALERLEARLGSTATAPASDDASVAVLGHNVLDLAEAIVQVKHEVLELGGGSADGEDRFNSAQLELSAIIDQTEQATGEILEAAEKVQEVLWTLREEGANTTHCDIIESKIIDIYTACSFQDLTGQRSSKVIKLVAYVEKRVNAMIKVMGLSEADVTATAKTSVAEPGTSEAEGNASAVSPDGGDTRPDAHLLNGPALEGHGIEQGDVDAMFDTPGANDEPLAQNDAAQPTIADDGETQLDEDAKSEGSLDQHAAEEDTAEENTPDRGSLGTEAASEAAKEETDSAPDVECIDGSDMELDSTVDDVANPETLVTNAAIVELHDAEILNQPAEVEHLAGAVVKSDTPGTLVDVEPLDFQASPTASDVSKEIEDDDQDFGRVSHRENGRMIINLPDDFVVDEVETLPDKGDVDKAPAPDADPSDSSKEARSSEGAKPATVSPEEHPGQDIFDVDDLSEQASEDGDADAASTLLEFEHESVEAAAALDTEPDMFVAGEDDAVTEETATGQDRADGPESTPEDLLEIAEDSEVELDAAFTDAAFTEATAQEADVLDGEISSSDEDADVEQELDEEVLTAAKDALDTLEEATDEPADQVAATDDEIDQTQVEQAEALSFTDEERIALFS